MLRHIDDFRSTGSPDTLINLFGEELPKYVDLKLGQLEFPGTMVEVLGRRKYRTEDMIATVPDPKHRANIIRLMGMEGAKPIGTPSKPRDNVTLELQALLPEDKAHTFREATGSAIYLSQDDRPMQYAVKELARRMSAPLEVDWAALKHLARYLCGPVYSRAVAVSAEERATYKAGLALPLTGFSDSDWAGCKETRRSTGCIQSNIASTVLSMSCQTQPGLPATSSSDTELRELSRAARELYFLRQLIQGDFDIATEVPHLFSDSAVGIQVARKLGPGNKLRHLEVFHFYVQELLRRKGELRVCKVKGVTNPANYLTKRPSSVAAVQEALAPLGMVNTDNDYMQNMVRNAAEIKVEKYKLGDKPL